MLHFKDLNLIQKLSQCNKYGSESDDLKRQLLFVFSHLVDKIVKQISKEGPGLFVINLTTDPPQGGITEFYAFISPMSITRDFYQAGIYHTDDMSYLKKIVSKRVNMNDFNDNILITLIYYDKIQTFAVKSKGNNQESIYNLMKHI